MSLMMTIEKDDGIEDDEATIKEGKPMISHESSNSSLLKTSKIGVEPTRFASLTFISNNASNSDREISIKNANLKSELIENKNLDRSSKESLFSNNNFNNILKMSSSNTNLMQKMSSINTSHSVYTDAYSTLDYDEEKINNNLVDGMPMLNAPEISPYDDTHSIYQQSLHSNNPDYINNNYNQRGNYNTNNNSNYYNNNSNQRGDTESFIYNDINSVDMTSLNDFKPQRKISNNVVFLGNSFLKDNNNSGNTNNNNLHGHINGHTHTHSNNELDFLDNQSISTVITSNDNLYHMVASKSPVTKRSNFQLNKNLSVSPTHSKVRLVSQKLFTQINNNNTPVNSNFSKIIHLNRKNNHLNSQSNFNDEFEDDDLRVDEVTNENENENENGNGNENENANEHENGFDCLNTEIDDHTGLTDAESILAKPYKNKRKECSKFYKYNQHSSINNLKSSNNLRGSSMSTVHKNTLTGFDYHDAKCRDYGAINNNKTYFDPSEEYTNFDYSRNGNNSPHDYKSMYYKQNLILNFILTSIYIFIMLVIFVSFLKLIVLQNFDNALNSFEVSKLANVLVSDEVLLLDMHSQALNINFQDINIGEMDLDLFLVTDESNLAISSDFKSDSTDITILLGNSNKFLTPLRFNGLLSLPHWSDVWDNWRNSKSIKPNKSNAQLKLYQPGKSFIYQGKPLSRDQWLQILNSKYKIIIRGNLKYSLPLVWQDQFISISTEIEIKPT